MGALFGVVTGVLVLGGVGEAPRPCGHHADAPGARAPLVGPCRTGARRRRTRRRCGDVPARWSGSRRGDRPAVRRIHRVDPAVACFWRHCDLVRLLRSFVGPAEHAARRRRCPRSGRRRRRRSRRGSGFISRCALDLPGAGVSYLLVLAVAVGLVVAAADRVARGARRGSTGAGVRGRRHPSRAGVPARGSEPMSITSSTLVEKVSGVALGPHGPARLLRPLRRRGHRPRRRTPSPTRSRPPMPTPPSAPARGRAASAARCAATATPSSAAPSPAATSARRARSWPDGGRSTAPASAPGPATTWTATRRATGAAAASNGVCSGACSRHRLRLRQRRLQQPQGRLHQLPLRPVQPGHRLPRSDRVPARHLHRPLGDRRDLHRNGPRRRRHRHSRPTLPAHRVTATSSPRSEVVRRDQGHRMGHRRGHQRPDRRARLRRRRSVAADPVRPPATVPTSPPPSRVMGPFHGFDVTVPAGPGVAPGLRLRHQCRSERQRQPAARLSHRAGRQPVRELRGLPRRGRHRHPDRLGDRPRHLRSRSTSTSTSTATAPGRSLRQPPPPRRRSGLSGLRAQPRFRHHRADQRRPPPDLRLRHQHRGLRHDQPAARAASTSTSVPPSVALDGVEPGPRWRPGRGLGGRPDDLSASVTVDIRVDGRLAGHDGGEHVRPDARRRHPGRRPEPRLPRLRAGVARTPRRSRPSPATSASGSTRSWPQRVGRRPDR